MDKDPPRLGDRKLTPRGKRRFLTTATAVLLMMTVGGFILGYELADGSKKLVSGILSAFASWILFIIAFWVFLATVNARRDRHPNPP